MKKNNVTSHVLIDSRLIHALTQNFIKKHKYTKVLCISDVIALDYLKKDILIQSVNDLADIKVIKTNQLSQHFQIDALIVFDSLESLNRCLNSLEISRIIIVYLTQLGRKTIKEREGVYLSKNDFSILNKLKDNNIEVEFLREKKEINIISGTYNLDSLSKIQANIFYVGVNELSCRCVSYFNEKEFIEIVNKAKEIGKSVYLMLNRPYHQADLTLLKKYINLSKELKVEGIVYFSFAVAKIAKSLNFNKLIYHADTLTTNSLDAKFLVDENHMVMLANEITLDDVNEITVSNPNKFGKIVFGYLNMSYSARKFLDNYFKQLNHKFHNKGNYFLQEETRDYLMPIIQEENVTSIYSGWILESLKCLKKLKINYYWMDPIFIDEEKYTKIVSVYNDYLNNCISLVKAKEMLPKLDHDFSDGYYFNKTTKVKVENNGKD